MKTWDTRDLRVNSLIGKALFRTLSLALGLAALGGPALAAAGPWVDHEQVKLRLLSASDATGSDDGSLHLGLQFKLEPGWKIYWRSPGDAGFPPSLDWSASENLDSAEMRWPVPHRFSLFGLETFGYAEEVVLPIEARLTRPGEAARLQAAVNYLVCEEICIPYDGVVTLDLPGGPAGSAREALLIDRFASLVPGDGTRVGLSLERASLLPGDEAPALEVIARSRFPFEAPDVLVEGPPGFVFDKPEVALSDGGKRAVLRLATARGPQAEGVLEGKRLTLTVIDGKRGLEAEVIGRFAEGTAAGEVLEAAPGTTTGPATGTAPPERSLPLILAFALLGGLILNLMPCVLPVLSIKLLSAVSHGGQDGAVVRRGFLASSAGILCSFLLLAAGAVALKEAGLAAGWGIQFQQPLFLTAMAAVVALFACNLFGLFEVRLPGRVGDLAATAGAEAERKGKLSGHFLTGAFATLLATPCSAPFLGTAVGFALASGTAEIFLIFAVLGLGLALPYLLVAAFPGLATSLPRPGPWMATLRRVLGLALAGTAVWLLTVLAAQVGMTASLAVGALLIAMAVFLALRRQERRPVMTALARPLAALAALLAVAAPLAMPVAAPDKATATVEQDWQPLDRSAIAALVADGRVVFVDVTADWCITCQVNKALVIDRDPVARALSASSVVPMRGDWTLPSEAISDYLASFGRYGIPFNAVYGPGLPEGEALPELLTAERVMEVLERARGGVAIAGD